MYLYTSNVFSKPILLKSKTVVERGNTYFSYHLLHILDCIILSVSEQIRDKKFWSWMTYSFFTGRGL